MHSHATMNFSPIARSRESTRNYRHSFRCVVPKRHGEIFERCFPLRRNVRHVACASLGKHYNISAIIAMECHSPLPARCGPLLFVRGENRWPNNYLQLPSIKVLWKVLRNWIYFSGAARFAPHPPPSRHFQLQHDFGENFSTPNL